MELQGVLIGSEFEPMPDPPAVTFADWYARYPRKQAKKAAQKAWKKLTEENRQAAMADDLVARYMGIEKEFIPHPATYLNGERWEDEIIIKLVNGHGSLLDDLTDTSWAE